MQVLFHYWLTRIPSKFKLRLFVWCWPSPEDVSLRHFNAKTAHWFMIFSVWIWWVAASELWSRQVHYIQDSSTGMKHTYMHIDIVSIIRIFYIDAKLCYFPNLPKYQNVIFLLLEINVSRWISLLENRIIVIRQSLCWDCFQATLQIWISGCLMFQKNVLDSIICIILA